MQNNVAHSTILGCYTSPSPMHTHSFEFKHASNCKVKPKPNSRLVTTPVTWDRQLVDSFQNDDDETKSLSLKGEAQPSPMPSPSSSTPSSSLPLAINRFTRYATRTLLGRHANRPRLSDLLWTFSCSFAALLALGTISLNSHLLPGVLAQWHKEGLPVLLGSFGTLTVLIFARPESEPVKVWNLVVGEILCVTLASLTLSTLGMLSVPLVVSRAIAMSLAVVGMMWTDSVHPPGGALVLVASDCPASSSMGCWLALYPNLVFTFIILLPLGLACNHLKRSVGFDFPNRGGRGQGTGNGLSN